MRASFNLFRVLAAGVPITGLAFLVGSRVLGEVIILLPLALYAACVLAIILAIFRVIDVRELLKAPYGRVSLGVVVGYSLVISFLLFSLTHGEGP